MTDVKEGKAKRWVGAALLVAIIGVGAFAFTAWNRGRELAEQESAFTYPCELATENSSQAQACVTAMKSEYKGPLDDPQRLANAAAEHSQRIAASGS